MKLFGPDNRELMTVNELAREEGALVIRGKIFGAMPITAKLTPQEARAALKLLSFRTVLFILSLPFRSGPPAA